MRAFAAQGLKAVSLDDDPVPELGGIRLAEMVEALFGALGVDAHLDPDCVAAFRVLHHEMTEAEVGQV